MKRNKRIIIGTVSVIILILIYGISLIVSSEGDNELIQSIEGTVLAINDDLLTIEDDNDTVSILTDEEEELEFSYIEMINQIYRERKIDAAIIGENFSEEEEQSINDLVSEISEGVKSLFLETKTEELDDSDN